MYIYCPVEYRPLQHSVNRTLDHTRRLAAQTIAEASIDRSDLSVDQFKLPDLDLLGAFAKGGQ